MQDDIAAIQQHPIPFGQTFGTDLNALGLQLLRQVTGNRRHMPVRAAASHDHMVGDQGFSEEIYGVGVDGLVVLKGREDQL